MSDYTHEFHEAGNGFPAVGEDVLICDDHGWHEIKKVASVSRIQTQQWTPNMIYLTVEDSENDWDDYDEAEQDKLYEDLYHVSEIVEDESE